MGKKVENTEYRQYFIIIKSFISFISFTPGYYPKLTFGTETLLISIQHSVGNEADLMNRHIKRAKRAAHSDLIHV